MIVPGGTRHRVQPCQQPERYGETGRVHPVDQPGPRRHREDPAERGTEQEARGLRHRKQRRRGGELLPADQPRQRGVEGGPLQGGGRHHHRRDGVERPQGGTRKQRVDQEQPGAAAEHGLAPAHQRPAVEPVREHAPVQPEQQQRHEFHHAEQPHRQRRAGELLRLHEQRDLAGLGAEGGHRPAGEDQAEPPRGPQWRQVRPQPRPALLTSTGWVSAGRISARRIPL